MDAETMIGLYIKAGYGGLCVTDHYDKGTFLARGCSSWRGYADRFLAGYRKAKDCAPAGFVVLLGAEIRLEGSFNDYLLYGVTEDFLYNNPSLYDYDMKSFHKLAHDNGILIFQAHPFRPMMTRQKPEYLDGVEVLNGNPRHDSRNDLAYEFAKKHKLAMSAGSDAHETEDVGRSGIMTKNKIKDLATLKSVLTEGAFEII